MATPLMGLTIPTPGPGGTGGPLYATQLSAAFDVIDAHDHASGNGARIGVAGLSIDADLGFAGFHAQNLKSVRLANQAAVLTDGADVRSLYSVNGELYYNDAAGNNVKLTAAGAINAASIGGIGGDYATSDASVTYSDSTKVYSVLQAAGITGKIACADLLISEAVVSANAITVKSPSSLAGAYSLTLFAALPADDLGSNVVTLTAAGVLAASQSPILVTPQIRDTSKDHSYIFAVSELAANRTITLPLLTGNDSFVFEAHTQTLTNKTLTAPVLGGTVTGTYTLGGTPTISAAALSGTFTGAPTFDGNPIFSGASGLLTNTITERTGGSGVTIDGVVAKDSGIQADEIRDAAGTGAPDFPLGLTEGGGNVVIPVGALLSYVGTTAPTGWLLCDGSTIGDVSSGADLESADYETLFNLVKAMSPNAGTEVFGNGDTVALPDLRGRVAIGLDNLGGSSADVVTASEADSLGGLEGDEEHTLTISEMPSHNHGGGNHDHVLRMDIISSGNQSASARAGNGDTTLQTANPIENSGTIINTQGSGAAHNNMPPYVALGAIIKT